jgi:hypothetical protein
MQVDPEYLRRQYASLSDEDLFEIKRKDLVEVAQNVYDEEVSRRKPQASGDIAEDFEPDADEPDWLEGAASAYAVLAKPGCNDAPKAARIGRILRNAGIPVHLSLQEGEAESADEPATFEYHVLVPGELSLHAASVLDKEVFNEAIEQTWKEYFRGLNDDQLRTADTETLFAGFRDRLKRVTKAYKKELGRRGIELPGPEA